MKLLAAVVACLLLASCSTRQIVSTDREAAQFAYQQRAASLGAISSWDMAGKLSVDDGDDGGSGKLSWKVRNESSLMNFRGALGRGAWQLDSRPGFAELQKSDGTITQASTVSDLLENEIGWHIPVNSLKWWALGVSAPGDTELLDLDSDGRVLAMQQDGWNISFDRYRQFDGVELPGRMDAVRGRYRVKMAVSKWTLFTPDPDMPAQGDD